MSRLKMTIIAILSLMIVVPVGAQVVLSVIQLRDFKQGGTAVGFFHHTPTPLYVNFTRGSKFDDTTRTLNVEIQAAPYNPDLGFTVGPKGVQVNTATVTRPTCAAAQRGVLFTTGTNGTGDAGVADLTYQCCKAADGTYSWVAVACQ